jgi:AmiR/NasT family two-component response regulator
VAGSEHTGGGDDSLDSDLHLDEGHLARSLHLSGSDLRQTLDAVVTAALATVPEADYAGLILVERGKLTPQATLGEPPYVLDVLQQRLGRGPCLESASTQSVIVVEDNRSDRRWPEFAERATALGVLSVLCIPLWVSDEALGALSLYSSQASAFGDRDALPLELFATHAALALANSRSMDNLRTALVNRDLIGQAKGILMERQRITADAAFDVLSKLSQAKNRKLVDVARQLVETGQLEV